MGLAIIFRVDKNVSLFHEYLCRLLSIQSADKIVLCSGYIQEQYYGYSVLDNDFKTGLCCQRMNGKLEIETIAGKLGYPAWRRSYHMFIQDLRAIGNPNITVNPYIARRKKWHAKIALAMQNNEPVLLQKSVDSF